MVPLSQFRAIFSRTAHQDLLHGNFNNNENASEIYVLSQQRPTGKPASSLTFRVPLIKQSSCSSDMMLERPRYKLRMMVLSKCSTVLRNISLCNLETRETRFQSTYLDQSQPPQVAQPPRRGRPPKHQVDVPEATVPEIPEVPEVQQPVPVKQSYADVVTRRGRISRPPRRYLD